MVHQTVAHVLSVVSAFFFMAVAPAIVAIRVRPSPDDEFDYPTTPAGIVDLMEFNRLFPAVDDASGTSAAAQ